MAIYNNGFPVGYQQFYPQYPQYQQQVPQQNAQQTMTPPTIHAEILQVDSEQFAENYPVAAGASQMMIRKDDSEIYIKTAFANGQSRLDVYARRPEKPVKPAFDPDVYITKDEFETRLNQILKEINNEHVQSTRSAKSTAGKSSAGSTTDTE